MKFNLTPILLVLNKLNRVQDFKDTMAVMTQPQRRDLRDKLVYRLMFDKKRLDDNDTDTWMEALKK